MATSTATPASPFVVPSQVVSVPVKTEPVKPEPVKTEPAKSTKSEKPARKATSRKKTADTSPFDEAVMKAMELFPDSFALGSAFSLLWEAGVAKEEVDEAVLEKIIRLLQAEIAHRH